MAEEPDAALLEDEFLSAVVETVETCRRLHYNPTAFMTMIHDHGALGAVKRLRGHRWNSRATGSRGCGR